MDKVYFLAIQLLSQFCFGHRTVNHKSLAAQLLKPFILVIRLFWWWFYDADATWRWGPHINTPLSFLSSPLPLSFLLSLSSDLRCHHPPPAPLLSSTSQHNHEKSQTEPSRHRTLSPPHVIKLKSPSPNPPCYLPNLHPWSSNPFPVRNRSSTSAISASRTEIHP